MRSYLSNSEQFQNFVVKNMHVSTGPIYQLQKCGVSIENFPLGGVNRFDRGMFDNFLKLKFNDSWSRIYCAVSYSI